MQFKLKTKKESMTHSTSELKEKIITTFNSFNLENMKALDSFYDKNAVFQDPLTKRQGLSEIISYYSGVYKKVTSIKFDFEEMTHSDLTFTAPWKMTLAVKGLNSGKPYSVEGLSIIKFNNSGLVVYHRDYVDIGAMVYEKIPLLGTAISLLKKSLKH
jgi:hypothetical protein